MSSSPRVYQVIALRSHISSSAFLVPKCEGLAGRGVLGENETEFKEAASKKNGNSPGALVAFAVLPPL
jgi:hypothetical protein